MKNIPTLLEVREVAKILPIGYYLGAPLNYEVKDDIDSSYFDPMNYCVRISYPQLIPVFEQLPDEADIEDDIRCVLYHEVSHAMLTPANLYDYASEYYAIEYCHKRYDIKQKLNTDWSTAKEYLRDNYYNKIRYEFKDFINVFEDQRIETINKNFFMRVNFPEFVKKMNDYKGPTMPKDVSDLFYHVVRFNDMFPDLVKKVYATILNHSTVNPVDDANTHYYVGAIFDIICDCIDIMNQLQQMQSQMPGNSKNNQQQQGKKADDSDGQMMSSGNQSKSDEKTESTSGNGEEKSEDTEAQPDGNSESKNDSQDGQDSREKGEQPNGQSGPTTNKHGAENGTPNPNTQDGKETIEQVLQTLSEEDKEKLMDALLDEISKNTGTPKDQVLDMIAKKSINEVLNKYNCTTNFNQAAEAIILRMLKKKSNVAKSLAGYSGRINPKNIHKPNRIENYRWFDKANPNGINATSGKFRINLFCDNSGSFDNNKNKANSIIRCLWNLSKKYKSFDFDLVTNGDYSELRTDANMEIECNGGTYLPPVIWQIYGSLQKPGQVVWNIVLFDGGLLSGSDVKNYAVFNHQNVIMICDTMDKIHIEKRCPNAKKIFTDNYIDELEDNLIKCMDQLFR